MPAILAIPPALSLIGSYASMANPVAILLSMPKFATAIPYMATKLKLTKIPIENANMGIITDLYPKSNPNITLIVALVPHELETSWIGM